MTLYQQPGVSLLPYNGKSPRFGERVFIGAGTSLAGDIEAGDDVNFWFNVSARGDVNYIRIGARTNVQDNTVIHVATNGAPALIGQDVTIGHSAVVHACTIEDACLIGMGSIVMDNALIRRYSLVAAGALVVPGSEFPERSLIVGSPAKAKRTLTQEEVDFIFWSAAHYCEVAADYQR